MPENLRCKPIHKFSAYELRHFNPPLLDGRVISEIYFINVDGRKITIDEEVLE